MWITCCTKNWLFIMSFFLATSAVTCGATARTRISFAFGQPRTSASTKRALGSSILGTRNNVFPWSRFSKNNSGDDDNGNGDNRISSVQPTWTHVPYTPGIRRVLGPSRPLSLSRRSFSAWTVPKSIEIPQDHLEMSFVRSSGAGGQNVNKLSTKVEIRFLLNEADWIPEEVRARVQEQQAHRINKDGYLALQSQEHRTQAQNRKAVISKLEEMLLQAWPRPKVRKQRIGITQASKERNMDFKRKRSATKASRGRVDF